MEIVSLTLWPPHFLVASVLPCVSSVRCDRAHQVQEIILHPRAINPVLIFYRASVDLATQRVDEISCQVPRYLQQGRTVLLLDPFAFRERSKMST